MEQANLLEMPEDEFKRLIADIEQSSLFKRLYHKRKLIRHQRFPRTDISSSFYQLEEAQVAAQWLGVPIMQVMRNSIYHSFLNPRSRHGVNKTGLRLSR